MRDTINHTIATEGGVTLTALEIAYLRRAVRVAHGEAVRERDRDGTMGRRADFMLRLDHILTAFADRDCPVRLTAAEG